MERKSDVRLMSKTGVRHLTRNIRRLKVGNPALGHLGETRIQVITAWWYQGALIKMAAIIAVIIPIRFILMVVLKLCADVPAGAVMVPGAKPKLAA